MGPLKPWQTHFAKFRTTLKNGKTSYQSVLLYWYSYLDDEL